MGFKTHERQVRAAINQLRKEGQPICSTGGEGGGYYLAAGADELDTFIARELHARAMDLLEQEQAMRAARIRIFGSKIPQGQERMF